MSTEYGIGFVVGALVVLIIFLVVWRVSGSESLKEDFDERQMLIRGIGYKYAFFVNLILLALFMVVSMFVKDIPLYPGQVAMLVIFISVVVYALYCIRKDAFFGVTQKARTYTMLLVFVVAVNLLGAVSHLRTGDVIEPGGYIGYGFFGNVTCVIGFGIVLIAILARNAERRREELADEES